MSARSRTVTIMFTDVVGSTALAQRLGEEAAQALRRAQGRILRQQFERFGAHLVKDTGDGFMVAFDSASQGVECAAAAQRAIAIQHAEGRYPELEVRIGLHTGEPAAEAGDLHGSDVDLAKRIETEAEGGQVLVSDVTRALSRRAWGLEFTPLGERALKGFAQRVALFQVRRPEEATAKPGLTRFTGRDEETALLRSHLEEAVRGRGGLVLVAGEPGVGKTRLVSELAIYAADRGLEVLSGRAYETEGMPPYLPFTGPLGRYLQDRSPKELRKELDGNGPYLAKLLPELRRLLPDQEEPPTLSPEGERYRLFESVCDFLLKIASRNPVLLSLDDLHWADEASRLLLQHLAPRLSEGPLLVVCSYRDTEAESLATLLAELRRQRLDTTVPLRPFGCEEAASLLEAILGQPAAPQAVEAVFAASEGNPFFTEELVWHLREQGVDLTDPGLAVEGWKIPEGVTQVIAGRLACLSGEANRLLAYSSVLGRDLSLKKVAAVTDRADIDALDLLEEAVASHVLREAPEGYAFAHPLIRETLYQGLTATRRRQLHRRTAEALEALHGADLELQQLVELAHHFFHAAARGEDVDKVIAYATRAGERALSQIAYEEAARLYQTALQALDLQKKPNERQRCELLLALGDAGRRAGNRDASRHAYSAAADIARKSDEPELLARAALGFAYGGTQGFVDEPSVRLLDEALSGLGEESSGLRARVLARLAEELYNSYAVERRASLSQQAVEIARRIGDQATLASALFARHIAVWGPENLEERLALANEMVALADKAGDNEAGFLAHFYRIADLLELGDVKAVDAEIERCRSLSEEPRQPYYLSFVASFRAMRALLAGRIQESEQLAYQQLALGQQVQNRTAPIIFAAHTFAIRSEQGRLQELEAAIKAGIQQYPEVPAWRCGLAYLYSELGRHKEARAEFLKLLEGDVIHLPRDQNWLYGVTGLAVVCANLDDHDHAARLYEALFPYAGRNVVLAAAILCNGAAYRYLGLLAATMRRWADAEQHFEDALQMNTRMGARPWLAWTQHDYAKMLLARRGPGDRKKAYALLKEALEAAREMGMTALEGRAVALMESRGGLMAKGPDGLTNPPVASSSDLTDGNR